MRIHGIVFIILGLIVAVVSYMLYLKGNKMGLFILIGIAMLVYGVLKLYIDRKDPKEEEELMKKAQAGVPTIGPPVRAMDIPRVCGNCGARNHPRANYCGNCGNRIN